MEKGKNSIHFGKIVHFWLAKKLETDRIKQ